MIGHPTVSKVLKLWRREFATAHARRIRLDRRSQTNAAS